MMEVDDTLFVGNEWETVDGIATAFTRIYGEEWRYCPEKGWIGWNGRHWEPDHVMYVQEQIRSLCRKAGQKAIQPWVRGALVSWRTMNAVERILRDLLSQTSYRTDCLRCNQRHICAFDRSRAFRCESLGICRQ